MTVTKVLLRLSAFFAVAASCYCQTYGIADFEQLAAPSGCIRNATASPSNAPAIPALLLPGVTISGGQVLKYQNPFQVTFGIPNDVYYTYSGCAGLQPTITIVFDGPASNVTIGALGEFWDPSESLLVQDDRGFNQTFSLTSSNVPGITVQFPESGIRKITLTLQGAWSPSTPAGFYLDNLNFYLDSVLSFVDPVPSLMSGAGVVTDPEMLATSGTLVKAVSADGVGRVLLTAQAAHVGEQITFSVLNQNGGQSNSTQDDGGVGVVGDAQSSKKQSVRIAAQDTTRGPVAFALYYPPPDFSRGSQDNGLASRTVQIQVDSAAPNTTAYRRSLTILRPPVILVHDLWEGPSDWDSFTSLVNDPRFFIRRAAFDGVLSSRIGITVPAYSNGNVANARESALGMAYNSPLLLTQITEFINEFRSSRNAAAGQADVVVHGMGGVVGRASVQLANYAAPESYTMGSINKMITIATPHLGTPFASALLRNENSCVANVLANAGRFSFSSAIVDGNAVSGGVGDLQGNGFGGGLSPALAHIQQWGNQMAPVGTISVVTSNTNTTSLDNPLGVARFIRLACGGSPLANSLTSQGWIGVFADFNDGAVPLLSQFAGNLGFPLIGVVSDGMTDLGFNAPSELGAQSPVATSVVNLLNTVARSNSFNQLP